MNRIRSVTIEAPAKINLGLEILGKRPDGFHEIRSILVMLALADTVRVTFGNGGCGQELPGIPAEANLIARALGAFHRAVPSSPSMGGTVDKRIPAAAGLGGASSDAAAALLAANELAGMPLSPSELAGLAATLGSDIPFFLGSASAFVSGRGTDLAPLPGIAAPVTLLLPPATIARKTQTLYSLIGSADLTDGARTERGRGAVERGDLPTLTSLANAFSQPLARLVPESQNVLDTLPEHGVDRFGLSGAGPAHYVIGDTSCAVLERVLTTNRRFDAFCVIRTRTRSMPPAVQDRA